MMEPMNESIMIWKESSNKGKVAVRQKNRAMSRLFSLLTTPKPVGSASTSLSHFKCLEPTSSTFMGQKFCLKPG